MAASVSRVKFVFEKLAGVLVEDAGVLAKEKEVLVVQVQEVVLLSDEAVGVRLAKPGHICSFECLEPRGLAFNRGVNVLDSRCPNRLFTDECGVSTTRRVGGEAGMGRGP